MSARVFEPDIETRREELTQRRDNLRLIAYRAHLDIEELEAQPHRDGIVQVMREGRVETLSETAYLTDKRQTRDNAYAAAERLQGLLLLLPPAPERGE